MVELTDSRLMYTSLVGLVAVMRLVELAISRRNIARLKARGAVEVGRSHYPAMVMVHTLFLICCPLEVWLLDRPWIPPLALAMVAMLALAAALRYWVIWTLGDRWSTRVVLVPGEPLITAGPFRFLRHPNYLAVIVEFIALPMVHTAWLAAAVFSAANALVLLRRIRVEDAALAEAGGSDRVAEERLQLAEGRR
jgi:methyltransferase